MRERESKREGEREIHYDELAHTIVESEKSHDLPSIGWRPKRAGGIIQPESNYEEIQEHL